MYRASRDGRTVSYCNDIVNSSAPYSMPMEEVGSFLHLLVNLPRDVAREVLKSLQTGYLDTSNCRVRCGQPWGDIALFRLRFKALSPADACEVLTLLQDGLASHARGDR